MPIYVFKCDDHGNFDKLVKMGTIAHTCPDCSKVCKRDRTSEIPSAPIMRGASGWRRRQEQPSGQQKTVDTSKLPYVTSDGGLAKADGTRILNPDGSKA